MREGSWPVTMVKREGAHSGELQYADSNTTPSLARASRFGVWITDLSLYMCSMGAAIWSAMMYRMLGRFWSSAMMPAVIE